MPPFRVPHAALRRGRAAYRFEHRYLASLKVVIGLNFFAIIVAFKLR